MKYLVMKVVPSEKADKLRVKRASRFLWVDERGVLWTKHPETGVECYIPPICEREDLIKEALKAMGFPNSNQLAETLRAQVFWEEMLADCIAISKTCLPR